MTVGDRQHLLASAIGKGATHPEARVVGSPWSRALSSAYSYGQQGGRFAGAFTGSTKLAYGSLASSAQVDAFVGQIYVPDQAVSIRASLVIGGASTAGTANIFIEFDSTAGTPAVVTMDPAEYDFPPGTVIAAPGSGLFLRSVERTVSPSAAGLEAVRVYVTSTTLGAVAIHSCVVTVEVI